MQAAKQLGISDTNIHAWRKRGPSFSVQCHKEIQEELKSLSKENAELKKINSILKSAAAFFSQDHLK